MNETDRHILVWGSCLRLIKDIIPENQFKTWFTPIRPLSLVNSKMTLEVPTDFFREYLEDVYLEIIKKALKKEIGSDARLAYKVKVVAQESMTIPAADVSVPTNPRVAIPNYDQANAPNAMMIPGIRKYEIPPHLNPSYCFMNLVQGECNKMGIAAGKAISHAPGDTPFNPLFLFGGSGLGKTHLAQAIGIAVREKFPDLVVLYVTGNEFKTQYMDAVAVKNKLAQFLLFYQKIDCLIVDDIQYLIGPGCQAGFFSIFNYLHQNGKQLIFTSDRAPVDLQNFEDRLVSRFKWGLSVELTRPDYNTRLSMLKSRSQREGVEVCDEVLEFLASRIKTNFRELEGSLISLIAHATLLHQACTLELAEKVVDNIVGEVENDITIGRICQTVCDYFNISRETLVANTRKRQIVQARQIAMYLSRNLVNSSSLSSIGAELGGKDHATVLHACNTVSDLMSTDKSFKQYITDIEKILVPVQ